MHRLRPLTPRTFWLTPFHDTDRPILGVVAGDDATLVVDAGASPAHAHCLLREMARLDIDPPAIVALTHAHWDHVFGAATLDAPTYAHAETQRIVSEMAGYDWSDAALDARVAAGTEIAFCRDMIKAELPERRDMKLRVPEHAFESEATIDLGGVTCCLRHVGGDHASDACIVQVPDEGVVFLGDCTYRDLREGAPGYTRQRLLPLLDRLLVLAADFYVPSHHDAPLTGRQFRDETDELRAAVHPGTTSP